MKQEIALYIKSCLHTRVFYKKSLMSSTAMWDVGITSDGLTNGITISCPELIF